MGCREKGEGSRVKCSVFGVEGSGFRFSLWGSRVLGFKVQGSRFRVQGLRLRVQGSRFRVQGSRFRVQGSRFGVQGSGFP